MFTSLLKWGEKKNKYDIILKAYKSEIYNISKLYKKHLYKIIDSK